MKYRVVRITNNIGEYPECAADTERFPNLIHHVRDEMDIFVVDKNGQFWNSDEFFLMEDINEFVT